MTVTYHTFAKRRTAPEADAFPLDLCDSVGGLIGDLTRFCVDTAISPQPVLALGASLVAVGAIAGRKYRTSTNLRTNLYAIGITDSGGGKDHARQVIKEAMFQAGLTDYLGGGKIASGPGLLTSLQRHPCRLFLLDEMGKFIKSVTGFKAPAHREEIWTNLTELYTSAGGAYLGTEYADQINRPRIDIQQPCCCIYGVTVPGAFWSALESGALIDGSLARFLVFRTDNHYPDRVEQTDALVIPGGIVAGLQSVVAGVARQAGNLSSLPSATPEPYTVPTDNEAQDRLRLLNGEQTDWLRAREGTGDNAVIARYAENVSKIALILAISDNPADPHITGANVRWGVRLVHHCIGVLLGDAARFVSENQTEADHKRVLDIIRRAGTVGIVGRDMARKTQSLDPKRRAVILASLTENGEISAEPMPPGSMGGRPGLRYRIAA